MRLTKKILLLSFVLLPVQGVWAIDTDLIVGARSDDNNGSLSGSARVFLSSDLMEDIDLDYRIDTNDNCPLIPNPDQAEVLTS
jgi:hypothetical protein